MLLAFQHFVLLIFAGLFLWVGWLMSHNPVKASRVFTLGQVPNKFTVDFYRIAGWVFTILFALGSIMYVILILLDLLGVKIGD